MDQLLQEINRKGFDLKAGDAVVVIGHPDYSGMIGNVHTAHKCIFGRGIYVNIRNDDRVIADDLVYGRRAVPEGSTIEDEYDKLNIVDHWFLPYELQKIEDL